MKRLTFQELHQTISLQDPQLITLVIENTTRFRDYVLRIFAKRGCLEELLTLSQDLKELDFDESATVVENPLILDLNSKQNLNALSRVIKRSYMDDIKEAVSKIEEALVETVGKIRLDFGVELTSEVDLKAEDVFKIANVRFEEDGVSPVERLVRYLFIENELRGNELAVILSLRSYFSESEIEQIVAEARYRGITILDIENRAPSNLLPNEKRLVIDNDLCFF